jgi:hypothetical protein
VVLVRERCHSRGRRRRWLLPRNYLKPCGRSRYLMHHVIWQTEAGTATKQEGAHCLRLRRRLRPGAVGCRRVGRVPRHLSSFPPLPRAERGAPDSCVQQPTSSTSLRHPTTQRRPPRPVRAPILPPTGTPQLLLAIDHPRRQQQRWRLKPPPLSWTSKLPAACRPPYSD